MTSLNATRAYVGDKIACWRRNCHFGPEEVAVYLQRYRHAAMRGGFLSSTPQGARCMKYMSRCYIDQGNNLPRRRMWTVTQPEADHVHRRGRMRWLSGPGRVYLFLKNGERVRHLASDDVPGLLRIALHEGQAKPLTCLNQPL